MLRYLRIETLRFSAWVFFVAALIIPLQPASADSLKKLEKEVGELKRINQAQSKNLATALNQIQEVLSEFQGLYGKVDQSLAGHRVQDKLIKDNQIRLNTLEDKISILMEQLGEIKEAGLLSSSQLKNFKQFQRFQRGLSKVNAEEYKGAVQTFRSFISKNPRSRYAGYAQYWIGVSYYAMRDFPSAVAEFQKVIKKYPRSNKLPAAFLKQGYSFYEMQSFEDAKAFLSKLVLKYPRSDEALMAKARIKKINQLLEQKAKEALEMQTTQ